MSRNDNPSAATGNALKEHLNRALQRELKKLNSGITTLEEVSTVSVLPPEKKEHRRIIREHEQYRLAAQLENMNKSSSVAMATDQKLIYKLTYESCQNDLSQSEELLNSLVQDKRNEEDKSKTLDEALAQERRVFEMVREYCDKEGITFDVSPIDAVSVNAVGDAGSTSQADAEQQQLQNPILMELEEQYKKLKKLNNLRAKQLGQFLSEHFPAPDEYDDSTNMNDLFQIGGRGTPRPLASIVQDLINSYLDTSSDSYIEIDSCMWGPHVEFLLRCGVAVRNPNNPSMIRLQKFGD